ncbi:MAG: 6,7-dimethyl-8-ribityllumazine synthase [Bacteroidetes bacterium]|nr:6,7-dimethyl-8-ribityllumazine synthase [Bacteroidota bacterium]
MASSLKNLSHFDPEKIPSGKGRSFLLIVAEWNSHVTFEMRDAAIATLKKHGADEKKMEVIAVPGTFELTFVAAKKLNKKYDAIICIGCVVKGETPHFDYICQGVASGLSALNAIGKIPVIFGVLTTDTMQQAIDRAGGKHGNKGVEAAVTALKMIAVK